MYNISIMQKINRLGKLLGPVGSIAGYFIALVGIIQLFSSFLAIVLIIIGLFIGFTSFAAQVDFGNKRFRNALLLFGIIPVGKWQSIDSSMGLSVNRLNRAWRTYSSSNRSFDIADSDYRIVIVDKQVNPLADIQRVQSLEKANETLVYYSEKLGLPIVKQGS